MERRDFVVLMEEILAAIPREFLASMANLTFLVEDWASPETLAELGDADPLEILGDYLGTPLPERSCSDGGALPDLIVLYQGAIEAYAEDFSQPLAEVIRETLVHEIAHYFGFCEEEMDAIEALWQEQGGPGVS